MASALAASATPNQDGTDRFGIVAGGDHDANGEAAEGLATERSQHADPVKHAVESDGAAGGSQREGLPRSEREGSDGIRKPAVP